MSYQDHQDHDDLHAMFDATAEEPSDLQVTRMAARATDIPGRRRSRWRWVAWFGLPATALAAFVVIAGSNGQAVAPAASVALSGGEPGIAALSPSSPAVGEDEGVELALADDELLGWDDEGEELFGSDMGFSMLQGPASEDDLDAWIEVADALLAEGG